MDSTSLSLDEIIKKKKITKTGGTFRGKVKKNVTTKTR